MNLFPETFYDFSKMPNRSFLGQAMPVSGPPSARELYEATYGPLDYSDPDVYTNLNSVTEVLYGVIGANADVRDWNSIMKSSNPVEAARQAAADMYSSAEYQAANLIPLQEQGYTPEQAVFTYVSLQDRVGSSFDAQNFVDATAEVASETNNPKLLTDAINALKSPVVIQEAQRAATALEVQTAATAQATAEDAAMRALREAQTEAARLFPWFEADLFVNATAEQKAAAYLRYIDMGKSDSEIRRAANAFFGLQKDADWQLLQQMASDLARQKAGETLIRVVDTRRDETGTGTLIVPGTPATPTQPAGNAGAIALAALAAALLLGA